MQNNIKEFWNHKALQLLNEAVLKAKVTNKITYYELGPKLQAIHPEGPNLRINFLEVTNTGDARICNSCMFSQVVIEPTHLGRQPAYRMCEHSDYCKQLIENKLIQLLSKKGRIFVTYRKDTDYNIQRKLLIKRKPAFAKDIL